MFGIKLLISLIHVLSRNNIDIFMSEINSIKLKIKGTGIKHVFSSSFSNYLYPNTTKINGYAQNTISASYNLTEDENIVELIWDILINDCHYMFYGCSDITEIDFSNFDTPEVTYMNSMFRDCSSLTSLDLSHFNISLVWCIEYMFYGCSKLEYIN